MHALARGRICMTEDELGLLRQAVQGARTYVEIGTLWGGSLVEALLSNPTLEGWAIDPMIGYYGGPDQDGTTPTANDVLANLDEAGVRARARLVVAYSHPFPLEGMVFDVGLVDGDHSEEAARRDIAALLACCDAVLVHDADDPAILRALEQAGACFEIVGRLALCKF